MLTFARAGVDAGRELEFRGSNFEVHWLSGKGSHSWGSIPALKFRASPIMVSTRIQ